jgi:uncharacterized protein (TIGR02118 family)
MVGAEDASVVSGAEVVIVVRISQAQLACYNLMSLKSAAGLIVYKTSFFLEGPEGGEPFRYGGEVAREIIASRCPTLAGFVQSRSLAEQVNPARSAPFIGVAELWFAREADALALHPESLEDLLTAETSVGATVTGMMHTIMRLPSYYDGGHIKGVFGFSSLESLDIEAFQRYWLLEHGPIAALTEGAVCYTQCHPPAAGYAEHRPDFDGISEFYWPDAAAARAAMRSRQMVEDQAADAQKFAQPGSVILFLAREEVVIPC